MKKLILLLIATFITVNAFSAYLRNVPVELKQPDGTVIICFVTGDEFNRRLHDKDNYTIVMNSSTGFYVYAILRGEELIPTSFIVGKIDAKSLSIKPGLDISGAIKEEKRATILKSANRVEETIPTKGNFNNIVISIRFSDQTPTSLTLQDYEDKFNSTTKLSLKSYYKEVSNSQLNITSYFFPNPQGQTILEYQDSHPRAYYIVYDAVTNPIGFTSDGNEREQTLYQNAIEYVKDQIIESQIDFDISNDGIIDNVVFILQGYGDSWGSMFWPMYGALFSKDIYIGNKRVIPYNKQLSSYFSPDVLCHEFFHSLSAPDLYHYTNDGIDPAGSWDIMGMTGGQHMTTYMKWKYGKWFDEIPEITQPGTYTLQPVSQSPYACYKIPSPTSSTEYFIAEYRKKEGLLESTIPINYLDGLIIYRINTLVPWGNAYGPPDELYIYRSLGDTVVNGDISKASFSAYANRTVFNEESSPSCFLSNGEPGWIDISNVTNAGNEISFTFNTVNPYPKPRNFVATPQNGQIFLSWNSPVKSGHKLSGYNVFLEGNITPINTSPVTDTTYLIPIPGTETAYTFKLTAKYQNGESKPLTCMFINTSNPSSLDSLSLVTLYNQCDGTNWQRTDNWLKGPLSTWYGVTVENKRVTELRLVGIGNAQLGLKNKIPKEIGNLTSLVSLELDRNALSGNIPHEIGNLTSLKTLSLSFNALTGSIPNEIGNLTSLRSLNLLSNTLTGNIPEEIGNLKNLEDIFLPSNKLSGELPDGLWALTNLKNLDLQFNELTGIIPYKIGQLINLTELSIGTNYFTGTIPKEISNLLNIEVVNFASNGFIGTIPIEFYNLVNLKHFAFSVNKLSGTIAPEIGNLRNLRTIGLWGNQFSGELPEEFGLLNKLEQIAIANNQFTGAIPKGLAKFTEGTFFSFWSNQFNDFPNISNLKKLQTVDIGNNSFTFEDIEPNINTVFDPNWGIGLYYQPQAKIGKTETIYAPLNLPYVLSVYCGGKNNLYQWFKNGQVFSEIQLSPDVIINPVLEGNNGEFFCRITNTIVPKLTIESNPVTLIGANKLIANAGNDRGFDKGILVTLDGSASYNPKGTQLTYKWTAPDNVTLNDYNVANPTFMAPEVTYETPFTFTLVVNDGVSDSSVDEVIITIKANPNQAPTANAGNNQIVNKGTLVLLDGSASTDPDYNFLFYKWTAPEGITLSSTTVAKPTFVAPLVSVNTEYTFSLVVNDGTVDSPPDFIVITVKNSNYAPESDAGPDQTVKSGTKVELNGSGSSDPDGNPLIYKWTAPAGILLSSTTESKPTFSAPFVSQNTEFIFLLVVNDGIAESPQDQVVVTVFPEVSGCPLDANYDIEPSTVTSGPRYGQSITINKTGILEKIKLTIWPDTPGNPHLILREWTSDIYENAFDGKVIATSNAAIDKPSVENWQEMSTFMFPSQPELAGGKKYTIEIMDGFPYVILPGTYSGGMAYETANPDYERDMRFTIHLCPIGNNSPIANAGTDQTVNEGKTVSLDGSASFDPDGNPLTYKWTAPAGITLSSNTAVNPTFIASEVTKNTIYTFILVVNDGTVNSQPDSINILIKNIDLTQTLNFNAGWNIFSIPVVSDSTNLKFIFQSLIDNSSLVKIQDEVGKSIENWGIFGGWKNNIGNISPTEGYKIKVSVEDSIEICGFPVDYPFAIPLNSGWNIIGYPHQTAYSGLNFVQQLIDRGTLVKVQDEGGNSIENWGIFGSWKNNIGNFMAGEGYKIKVSADDTLWVYESYPKSSAVLPEIAATSHFKTAFTGNALDHMNINLVGLPINVLRAGDELAIFDGTTCVGAVTLTSRNINDQSVSIAASAKDIQGMPGFTEGNPITLKLWNSNQNTEFILEPEIVKGTSTFAKHETTVASLEKYTETGFKEIVGNGLPEINCYPNPFNHEVTVEIKLVKDSEVQVEVLNQLGQRVKYITTKHMLPVGLNKLTWNGRNENNHAVSTGIYHLKVNVAGAIIHKKIVYSK
jgi:M6 family metalloprotease-like protein